LVPVTDKQINYAIRLLAQHSKRVVEGGGAASVAAAIKLGEELRRKKIVGLSSCGNIPADPLLNYVQCRRMNSDW
jgi:threonine dehydratase